MKILLVSDDAIRLESSEGPLEIQAIDPDQSFSPFHMLAGGLASCTFSVFSSWAEQAMLDWHDLAIEVSWTFADDPHRVASYDLRFTWPSLPARRLDAARRVAELCTVHATFLHPPRISIGGTVRATTSSGK